VTILLVEDNNGLGAAIAQALFNVRYRVEWRRNLDSAYEIAFDAQVDLILLDRNLPDGDGLEFLKRARADGLGAPVLMMSERGAIEDRVAGLDAGADDYLVKPFAFAELVARCRALLRRPRTLELEPIRLGNLTLKPDTLELAINETPLSISRREGELLVALLRRHGRVCTRAYLEGALYDSSSVVSPNALETAISRLRSLLVSAEATVELKTVRSVGYSLNERTT
jgi:DNA-binding response OmpR family regulator